MGETFGEIMERVTKDAATVRALGSDEAIEWADRADRLVSEARAKLARITEVTLFGEPAASLVPDDGLYRTTTERMAEGILPAVASAECACGDFDCEHYAFGYRFCVVCDEHHRAPCPASEEPETIDL